MRFLYDNLAAIYIALVAALMAWLYGGTMSKPLIAVVPWLMLFMTEVLFVFPQRHKGESTYDARERVWKGMKRDPLVWSAFAFILLLAVPFFNGGLCPNCDAMQIAQGARPEPPVGFLPFCVSQIDHLNVFLWFVTAFSCMIATKHCLVKRGKRMLVEMLAWNGAALAVFGFVESVAGAPGPFWETLPNGKASADFFSTWGYVNIAGDYFTTMFGISVALWRRHYDDERTGALEISSQSHAKPRDLFWKQNLYLIPAVLCFIAAITTMSRSAILMASSLLLICFAHTFLTFISRIGRAQRVKAIAVCGAGVGVLALAALAYMPTKLKKEVRTIDTVGVLDRLTGKNENHVTWAKEIWMEHPLFGCGGWGYKHFSALKHSPQDREAMAKYDWAGKGQANVHNDYMQFLAEHGAVGLGLFFAIVLLLLIPFGRQWKAMAETVRFASKKDRPPRPVQIFIIPAPVFCILLALVATAIHAFADCPFRSAAVLTHFFVLLAAIDGFMPKIDLEEMKSKERHHHHHHHHSHS